MLFVYVQSLYSSFLLYLQKFNVRLYNQYNRYFRTCVLSKVQLLKQREFVGAYSIVFFAIDYPGRNNLI